MKFLFNYCIIGAFCDLVWSDPEDVETWTVSPRGAGWLFGSKVTYMFMEVNDLKLICRAHQLVQEGMLFLFINITMIFNILIFIISSLDKKYTWIICTCYLWQVIGTCLMTNLSQYGQPQIIVTDVVM